MTAAFLRLNAIAIGLVAASPLLLSGCPPQQSCSRGQPITIPSADVTPPSVHVDVRGRGGALVQLVAGTPGPTFVQMPKGAVTIDATARDPEGVRKLTIAVQKRTCTTPRATGQQTCVTATPQTFTSADTGVAGGSGCTEKFLSTPGAVNRTLTTTRDEVEESVTILVTSQNFGGRNTTLNWTYIVPLP
jgi:hypothetical protein